MNVSKIRTNIQNWASKTGNKLGETVQGDGKIAKIFKQYEANGADNSFLGLATIMGAFVVVPRVKSALKRNPDNKEATKDEIKEILFRDLQTIAIILFGLKSMNSVIGNISTKVTGIPMVENPYKKVFAKNMNFGERLKNFGHNILATLHPTKGSKSFDGETIAKKYSNLNSKAEITKMIDEAERNNGRKEAVFAKIKESVMSSLDNTAKANETSGHYVNGKLSTQGDINKINEKKEYFRNLTLEKFYNGTMPEDNEQELVAALANDRTNKLAFSAKVVNSALKTLALGIEVAYLGFGLPALNQKRLEKKYLSEKPLGEQRGDTFTPLNDKTIKAQEIKLYSSFLK